MSILRSGSRIAAMLLLIAVMALGAVLWFDYLGIIDAKQTLSPLLTLIGRAPAERIEEPLEFIDLDQVRLSKQYDSLDLLADELDRREMELKERENEFRQMVDELRAREQEIEEREKSFNERLKEYDNRVDNLRQAARYFTGMPPEDAVNRLLEMDDQDVIDIFRTTERLAQEAGQVSLVAFWLSLMPPERAAVLKRKMIRRP